MDQLAVKCFWQPHIDSLGKLCPDDEPQLSSVLQGVSWPSSTGDRGLDIGDKPSSVSVWAWNRESGSAISVPTKNASKPGLAMPVVLPDSSFVGLSLLI
ncbi:MAG: hypothetical protein ACFB0G_22925 [Leptolyngbyaceae cyanobacterium]